ncbi:hypothetical protein ACPFMO_004974 [Escherichia coli]|uniref:hypothetical protein n=1 Tax=Escherichia coli TaxID=562 RepID=UPI00164F5467|nr:hypothetical protein [Escherichia coli]EEZ9502282.1 hypothetical protein [Escherichia coli]EHI0099608.1 hypothetical protein [Escherichia coli]ELI0791523.1 hypothetical protein [Escherichia coli]MBI1015586.1 hypothetical protein [Escherichia coli]MCB4496459.1 hypothetical protein [Escherichia coli]
MRSIRSGSPLEGISYALDSAERLGDVLIVVKSHAGPQHARYGGRRLLRKICLVNLLTQPRLRRAIMRSRISNITVRA